VILERVELTLTGPDEWPAEEGAAEEWAMRERHAREHFGSALYDMLRELKLELPEGFEVEKA